MNTTQNILITGGTGLVGRRLTTLLQTKGYNVSYLSRKKSKNAELTLYQWDIENGKIDAEAFTNTHVIVNLAGAGVADKYWTESYKQEIYDSRVKATNLLFEYLKKIPHQVHTFIGASAIGIYGTDTQDKWVDEQSPLGHDFLAQVVKDWEISTDQMNSLNIRTIKVRIGIVLAKEGGALPKLTLPVKLFAGAAIASGKQYISWIHIDDLCQMIIYMIENQQCKGTYNAVAPNPATNAVITQTIGKVLQRPIFLPNVPAFVLKMGMGGMASTVIGGNRVKADKLQATGFRFAYPDLRPALENLLLDKPA
jgi:uncharacterized protein (TIGR01777 family)